MVLSAMTLIHFILQAISHYETAADYYKGEGSSRFVVVILFKLLF